jgi:hypothetical protein
MATKRTTRKKKRVAQKTTASRRYNPNSIDAKLASLTTLISEQHRARMLLNHENSEKLDRIETQTVKTNGRVTTLEEAVAIIKTERKVTKAYLTGAFGLFTVLGTVVGAVTKIWPFH